MQNLKDLKYEIKKNMTYLNSNFFSFQLFRNNEFFNIFFNFLIYFFLISIHIVLVNLFIYYLVSQCN